MDERTAGVAGRLIDAARQTAATAIVLVSHSMPICLVDREFKQADAVNVVSEREPK
jgi:hypothetical protein